MLNLQQVAVLPPSRSSPNDAPATLGHFTQPLVVAVVQKVLKLFFDLFGATPGLFSLFCSLFWIQASRRENCWKALSYQLRWGPKACLHFGAGRGPPRRGRAAGGAGPGCGAARRGAAFLGEALAQSSSATE